MVLRRRPLSFMFRLDQHDSVFMLHPMGLVQPKIVYEKSWHSKYLHCIYSEFSW